MGYSFEGEKMLWQGRKRDFIRSRLSEGKRTMAWDEAERIYKETKNIDNRRKRELSRKQKIEGRDDAMNSALKAIKEDKSIKRIIF